MRRIYLASPYSGDTEKNTAYARLAMRDALARGEAPFLPHLLYTQVLDDTQPDDRLAGMASGESWLAMAEALVVYTDLGISSGMTKEIAAARTMGLEVEDRRLALTDAELEQLHVMLEDIVEGRAA